MLTKEYIHSLGIEFIINYLRKSRQDVELEKRTGEDTLKSQTDLMDRVLRPLGVPFIQKPEIGSGDKISTRPVFQEIITELTVGKYQAIAVKEISRMGRGSYTDMGIIYDLIIEKRIFIITPYKVYDPRNQADLRQIRFELFMSREEFETTRERLSGGRLTRALEGRWMSGKPPYGYSIDLTTRKLVVKEEEAEVVRLLYDIFVNGLEVEGEKRDVRFRAISTYFSRIGIPTPKGGRHWRPENLEYMVGNDVYIGIVRYRTTEKIGDKVMPRPEEDRVVVENAHESIVDISLWNRAQEKLQDKQPVPRTRLDRQPNELTGLVRCSCGSMMIRNVGTRSHKSSKTGEVHTYNKEILWCKNVDCGAVGYQDVLRDIESLLRRIVELEDKQIIKYIESGYKKSNDQQNRESALKFAEKRKEQLQEKLVFIHDQYEDRFYDKETFLKRKSEVEKELAKVNELIQSGEVQGEKVRDEDVQVAKMNLSSVIEVYPTLNKAKKNRLLHALFYEVVVKKTGKGRGKIKATFDLYTVPKADLIKYNFFDLISM